MTTTERVSWGLDVEAMAMRARTHPRYEAALARLDELELSETVPGYVFRFIDPYSCHLGAWAPQYHDCEPTLYTARWDWVGEGDRARREIVEFMP